MSSKKDGASGSKKGSWLGSLTERDQLDFLCGMVARGDGREVLNIVKKNPSLGKAKNQSGRALIMEAIFYKDAEIAEQLIAFSDMGTHGCGKTPLMAAAQAHLFALALKMLPESDARSKNARGQTALHLALEINFESRRVDAEQAERMIQELALACGPSEQSLAGWTALHCAVNAGCLAAVKILAPMTDLSLLAKNWLGDMVSAEQLASGPGRSLDILTAIVSAKEAAELRQAIPSAPSKPSPRRV